MKFEINGRDCELEIENPEDFTSVALQFVSNPVVSGELDSYSKGLFYRAYSNDGGTPETVLDGIVTAYLEGGEDGILNYLMDNEISQSTSDFLYYTDNNDCAERFTEDFYNKFIVVHGPNDIDDCEEFQDVLTQHVNQYIEDKMIEFDDSTYLDLFSSRDEIKLVFIEGFMEFGYLEELSTSSNSFVNSVETLIANRNAMLVFRLLNISPASFVDFMKEEYDIDLLTPNITSDLSEYRQKDRTENANAWRFVYNVDRGLSLPENMTYPSWLDSEAARNELASVVRVTHDMSRPQAVSMKNLYNIIENSDNGVATYNFRGNVNLLVKGEYDKPFIATGGQIGVHGFLNGTGHMQAVVNEVLIDPSRGAILAENQFEHGPGSLYGFTHKALDASFKAVTVSNLVQCDKNHWRSSVIRDDGGYAEVYHTVADDNADEYWVSTHAPDGSLVGPRSTSEVFISLEDAEKEVERLIFAHPDWDLEYSKSPSVYT